MEMIKGIFFLCSFLLYTTASRDIFLKKRVIKVSPLRRKWDYITRQVGKIFSSQDFEKNELLVIQFSRPLDDKEKRHVIEEFRFCDENCIVGFDPFSHSLGSLAYVVQGNLDYVMEKISKNNNNAQKDDLTSLITHISRYKESDKTFLDFQFLNERRRDVPISAIPHSKFVIKLYHPIDDLSKSFENLPHSVSLSFPSTDINQKKKFFSSVIAKMQFDDSNSISYFKSHPNVIWIDHLNDLKINNAVANTIVLSGQQNQFDYFWKKGLTGASQRVGIVDTGVDWENCYFYDPATPTVHADFDFEQPDLTHRKFLFYRKLRLLVDMRQIDSDDHDRPSGHGTHVAGSLLGSTTSADENMIKYNGIAKDARLYFTDIENDHDDLLLIPDDIETLFATPAKRGVLIHSNSWSCGISTYVQCVYNCYCVWNTDSFGYKRGTYVSDSTCQKIFNTPRCCSMCNKYSSRSATVDRFLYNNQEHVILFASGNDGAIGYDGTVSSPATAKNIISVGASITTNKHISSTCTSYFDIQGAFSVVKEYTSGSCCSSISQCCSYSSSDTMLQNIVRNNCCPSSMSSYYTKYPYVYNENSVADFTSRGPTTHDGRVKPEIVTPGYKIISAHSNGNVGGSYAQYCNPSLQPDGSNDAAFLSLQGTSMACPIAAGLAALIRQYYCDGYSNITVNPSGPLVKATVIHSAQQMSGSILYDSVVYNMVTNTFPTNEQGYGIPNLKKTLFFNQNDDNKRRLYGFDRVPIMHDEKHVYCYEKISDAVKGELDTLKEDFRVTLTWYDYPAVESAAKTLINDIDMYLCIKESAICFPPNNNRNMDHVNVVEQVRVPVGYMKKGTNFAFVVKGFLIQHPTKYSLVFSGAGKYVRIAKSSSNNCTITDTPYFPLDLSPFFATFFVIFAIVCSFLLAALLFLILMGCIVYGINKLIVKVENSNNEMLIRNTHTGYRNDDDDDANQVRYTSHKGKSGAGGK